MLNDTQRSILEAYLKSDLEEISSLAPQIAIDVYEMIRMKESEYITKNKDAYSNDIVQIMNDWRNIINHECPQNRKTGITIGDVEPGYVCFRDENGDIKEEKQGLLSLTASNDNTCQNVEKRDITTYFNKLMDEAIDTHNLRRRDATKQEARIRAEAAAEIRRQAEESRREVEEIRRQAVEEVRKQVEEETRRQAEEVTRQLEDLQINNNNLQAQRDNLQVRYNDLEAKQNIRIGKSITNNYKTGGKTFSLVTRNKYADEKYDNACDREMSHGKYIALGGVATLATFLIAGPICGTIAAKGWIAGSTATTIGSGIAAAEGAIMIGGTAATAVGGGMAGHGYAAKKVGRNGRYTDLIEMATHSIGYAGKECIKNFEECMNREFLQKLCASAENAQTKGRLREDIIKSVDSLLKGETVESVDSEDFNQAISFAGLLLIDLNNIYEGKNCRSNILIGEKAKYAEQFSKLSTKIQAQIIDAITDNIKETLLMTKDVVSKNETFGDYLAIELRRAQTESCIIL